MQQPIRAYSTLSISFWDALAPKLARDLMLSGELRSQGISRHGTDQISRNSLSLA